MFESMYLKTSKAMIARSHCLKRLRTSFIAAGSMTTTAYNADQALKNGCRNNSESHLPAVMGLGR